jgi:hypothetical protein
MELLEAMKSRRSIRKFKTRQFAPQVPKPFEYLEGGMRNYRIFSFRILEVKLIGRYILNQ